MHEIEKRLSVNDYIETYTGKMFRVMFPSLEDVDILDIAHSLSMQCRYTGHSKYFYSIAEHSFWVSKLCSPENALWGLLHDASEAYLTDVAAPIKPYLTNYKTIENNLMEVICYKYGISIEHPAEVKKHDMNLLRLEAKLLMKSGGLNWKVNDKLKNEPLPNIKLELWNPETAEKAFLAEFDRLTNELKKV